MELPVYELKIDESKKALVNAIALVENPAIESDFIAFAKEQKNLTFSFDDERMELIGAAMIPNMKIYRKDGDKEYYVFFTAETIREISQVFFKNNFQSNLNIAHTSTPAKSYVFQSYIVDSNLGMTSPKNLNLVDESWVIGVKVTDKAVWQDIKDGKVKGFSIEGIFQLFESDLNTIDINEEEEVLALIKQIKKLLNNI